MTIYIDELFLLNFIIDFLILLTESITLKYVVNIKKIIISALLGSVSLLVLFIQMNNITLLLFKIIISILLVTCSFGFKSISFTIKNILYFFFISIIYGGFLYFIKDNFTLKTNGLIFFDNEVNINIFILVIFSPIILYIYIKQIHNRYKINLRTKVVINVEDKEILLNGFIDTGNTLKEPYGGKDVMITNNIIIKNIIERSNYLLIPCTTIKGRTFIKGSKFNDVLIENKKFDNVVIAYTNEKIKIDNIDIILNQNMIGDIYD